MEVGTTVSEAQVYLDVVLPGDAAYVNTTAGSTVLNVNANIRKSLAP